MKARLKKSFELDDGRSYLMVREGEIGSVSNELPNPDYPDTWLISFECCFGRIPVDLLDVIEE